ncbi:hypothetical protein P700755_001469 [Psychroflexus torquis ATCC 700755]|uniref:Lipocalin-like domain-containing protein n=1 Tax=Psychroflexus torquis (strain ATCC 700755 / CIP 106069 / ACAM 623) TaxID=313595 RepID=K4IET4_PSYTT|nr:hypothetical protein [Psychroflexus torquis]AFU68368.1 hypothetical protein P700755_001469 [Psychroflexus torquis ATCC 700755]
MKKILLTSVLLTLLYTSGFSQTLNTETLCKKWYLEKYEVMWVDYEPEEKEKNDYMLLKSDMTYMGLDEGIKTAGKWTFNTEKNYFTMFNDKGEAINFFIDKLSMNKMVLNIDIKEMDGVDIHYTTKE